MVASLLDWYTFKLFVGILLRYHLQGLLYLFHNHFLSVVYIQALLRRLVYLSSVDSEPSVVGSLNYLNALYAFKLHNITLFL